MEFNKLVSLVLGFIVVVLLLVWVTGRLRGNTNSKLFSGTKTTVTKTPTPTKQTTEKKGWNPFGFLFNKSTPTPTPKKVENKQVTNNITPTQTQSGMNGAIVTDKPVQNGQQTNQYQPTPVSNTVTGVTQIPNTGAPTLLIPLALSALAGGTYLSRMKKK